MNSPDAIVVGGGISGLAAAWRLLQAGLEPLLLEAGPRAGGVIDSVREGEWLLEQGPNTVRATVPLVELVDALGLGSRLLVAGPAARRRYVCRGGRLHRLPGGPLSLLISRLWSARAKLALLGEPLRGRGWREGETVGAFFRRRLGEELLDYAVEPFVGGTFAGDPDRLEVESAFPRLVEWERDAGSLLLGALRARGVRPRVRGLVSFPDGLAELPRALVGELGQRVRCGAPVVEARPEAEGWRVGLADGGVERAPRLVLAVRASVCAGLVRHWDADLAADLDAVRHAGLALVHLGLERAALERAPDGFGYLNPRREGCAVLGMLFPSNLFEGRAPAGFLLASAFIGGDRQPELLQRNDEELVACVTAELERHFGLGRPPELVHVVRHAEAIPQYGPGHAALERRLAAAEAAHPGLALVGSYRGGVSVSDRVAYVSGLALV